MRLGGQGGGGGEVFLMCLCVSMYAISICVLTCLHIWLTSFSCSVFSPFILMAVLLDNLLFLKKKSP